ncbi:hypothetical protein ACJX0J_030075, partial [Zea mays]
QIFIDVEPLVKCHLDYMHDWYGGEICERLYIFLSQSYKTLHREKYLKKVIRG